ncbi:hypothetical protein evm_002237 [Chilo suppressalis]|nr:hypothetical protein evm_002237 [Chilo suppressalis]
MEYIVHNLPVTWDMAKILCRGHHNGTLAILDTKDKSEFLAEALSESQFLIESVWIGARRASADDPAGYRWSHGVELRRTAGDVMGNTETEGDGKKHYPMWLNRTHVPVPEGGADCVALERVYHDRPVFVDLQCQIDRPFVCERDAQLEEKVSELKVVRCRTGLYHIYGGRMDWHQAAAYCALNKMSLANIGTMHCLKKLGMSMLKTRPTFLRPLLDIGLPHGTPQSAVLRYPHQAAPSTFDDVVSSPCWGPPHAAASAHIPVLILLHHQSINVPTAVAQPFPMDGIGRLGHDPPRGPSADWRVLTTADAAGTNGLTHLPKHGAVPMTDHCESCF